MGHDLFFYALLLLRRLCLRLLLDWAWPRGRPTTGQTTPTPAKSIEKRSYAPILSRPHPHASLRSV
jgi:hypothetical protein